MGLLQPKKLFTHTIKKGTIFETRPIQGIWSTQLGVSTKILKKFGFQKDWITWVMECITSPSFFVLINGEPSQLFHASIDIKQGDPQSSYLFILYAKGLRRLIRKRKAKDTLAGIRIGLEMNLTHLQFVDDRWMWENSLRKVTTIRNLLDYYIEVTNNCSMKENSR